MPPAPLTADGPAVFVSVGENAVVGEGVSYVHMHNLKLVGPAPFDPAESDNEVSNAKRVLGPQLHARGTGVGCGQRRQRCAGLWDERRDHALGHPLPLSNFSDVRKRGVSHAVHTSTPGSLSSFSGLDHGGSVPASRRTSNSWGVSASRHSDSVLPV